MQPAESKQSTAVNSRQTLQGTDMDIKELATLTAAEMDDVHLRNVPAIILEQYATRLIAAYLKEQEPVVRVVDGGGELHLPKLQWVSANVSLETPIGSDLFLAPPLPTDDSALRERLKDEREKVLVEAWGMGEVKLHEYLKGE